MRVPKAGGTLFNLSNPETWTTALSPEEKVKALGDLPDSSLLILADILPTGVFAALQAINHPKLQPILTGIPWPLCLSPQLTNATELRPTPEDRILTVAVIGLGPVGVCATVSLLDALATRKVSYRIVAVDRLPTRREKMKAVFSAIAPSGKGNGEFVVVDMNGANALVKEWTGSLGCNAVLEVCQSIILAMICKSRLLCRWLDTRMRCVQPLISSDHSVSLCLSGYMGHPKCPLPELNCTTRMCLLTLADVQHVRCFLSHLICSVSELCWLAVRRLIGVFKSNVRTFLEV